MIYSEIRWLSSLADICVHARYDPHSDDEEAVRYSYFHKQDGVKIDLPVDFSFEGTAVWYLARRSGKFFRSRKILIRIEDGRFVQGQVGSFEGYWDEFPQYVAEDRWLAHQLEKSAANEGRRRVLA